MSVRRNRYNRHLLNLERLEDRTVPATHIWQGPVSGGLWSNAANWDTGVPTSGEAGGTNIQFNGGINSIMDIVGLEVDQITFTAGGNEIDGTTTLTINGLDADDIVSTGNNILDSSLPIQVINQALTPRTTAGNELSINGVISGSVGIAVPISNDGDVLLGGNNTFTGQANVQGGRLVVTTANALGSTSTGTVVTATGTLLLANITTAEQITINGGVVTTNNNLSPTITGDIILGSGTSEFNIPTGATMTLSGVISGANSLRKTNTGTLVMSGAGSNTYTGATFVNNGTLRLSKTSAIALAGSVGATIGDGVGAANTAVLQETANNNIANTYPVAVNPDGRFVQNAGVSDQITFLHVNSGGSADAPGLVLISGLLLEGFGSSNNVLSLNSLTGPFSADFDGQLVRVLDPNNVTYDGIGGNDTLVGTNVSQQYNITGANAGNIASANFSFTNVENVNGPSAGDILAGPNVATTWNITGLKAGNLHGINFSGMEQLTGGNSTDTLDYATFPSGVSVDLTAGTATGMAGITGFENVTGSADGDTLVGNSAINTMSGLGGNDVIIGGPGNDVFFGGTGNDEFIWNPGDGSDIVEGDADADTLTFNGSTGNEIFQLSANGSRGLFQRNLGNIFMDTNQVETLVVNGIGGTDDFRVNDTTGIADLTLVDINSGTGNDIYAIIPSPIARIDINGGTGTNTLTIDLAGTTNPVHNPTSATSGNTTYGNREDVDYQNIQNFSGINGTFGSNTIPVVTPPPNQGTDEGFLATFLLGSFTDSNNSGNYTVTINWGDGTPNTVFSQATAGNITLQDHAFAQDGVFTVTITVADADGTSAPASFTHFVSNVTPGIIPPANQGASSGVDQSFNLGSFTDPGADAPWNININWGDGSSNTNFSVNTPGVIPVQNHTYASPGNFTVTITVNDDDISSNSSFQVSVANVVPVVTPPANQSAQEGTNTSFNLGSFADTNNSGNYTITVNWGDGTPNTVFNQAAAGAITLQNHTFAQDGNFTVTVTVADADGTSVPASFQTFVSNVLPVRTPPATQSALAGISQLFDLGSFVDPGNDAPWGVVVNWGDGTPNTTFQVNAPGVLPPQSHTYATDGNFTIVVNVSDDDGTQATTSLVTVANPLPIVSPPVPQASTEGASTQFLLGTFTDVNNSGNYTVTVNWGDGTPNTVFNQATTGAVTFQNHTFAQDGNFTVTITVADVDGTSSPVSFLATVQNVLPIAVDSPDQFAVATIAQSFELGSFSDPGDDAPWSITVNWGDGSPNGNFTVNTPGALPNLTHTFASAGTFNVVVTVSDDDGFGTSDYLVTVIPPEAHVLGNVFRDFNNNGLFNSPEVGLAGITLFADVNGNGLLDVGEPSSLSDASGNYDLVVGFEGAVNVRQVIPDGFKQTTSEPATVFVNFGDVVIVDDLGLNRIIKPTIAISGRTGTYPFLQARDVDGTIRYTITPYAGNKKIQEVRLAAGDVNDDGIEDIFTIPGPGGSSLIKVFDGATGSLVKTMQAFISPVTVGFTLASGDVNGDGISDVAVGTDKGSNPTVMLMDGATGQQLRKFIVPSLSSKTGVRVALGDLDGDGSLDIITSPAVSNYKTPIQIRAVDAISGLLTHSLSLKPLHHGIASLSLAAGDLDGDGRAEILLSTNRLYLTKIQTLNNGQVAATSELLKGIIVALKDVNGDGIVDKLFAGGTGQSPRISIRDGSSGLTLLNALILSESQRKGLVIA